MAYVQKNNPFKKRPTPEEKIRELERKIDIVQGWQDVGDGEWDKKAEKGLNKEVKYTRKLNKLREKHGL